MSTPGWQAVLKFISEIVSAGYWLQRQIFRIKIERSAQRNAGFAKPIK